MQAIPDTSILACLSRLEDCLCNAICIQGMNTYFYTRAERERSNSDFSQHLSLSLHLSFTHPQFAFIHLNWWQRIGYFNEQNNSLFWMNMKGKCHFEHWTWNATKLNYDWLKIRRNLFLGGTYFLYWTHLTHAMWLTAWVRWVQYRKYTHSVFLINIKV